MRKWCFCLSFLSAALAWSQPEGYIGYGGSFLLQLRVPAGWTSVDQRVEQFEVRLRPVLGDWSLKPEHIWCRQIDEKVFGIYAKNILLITATEEDARATGMSLRGLAEHWTQTLRVLPEHTVVGPPHLETGLKTTSNRR
jgi:hypothetical protein